MRNDAFGRFIRGHPTALVTIVIGDHPVLACRLTVRGPLH